MTPTDQVLAKINQAMTRLFVPSPAPKNVRASYPAITPDCEDMLPQHRAKSCRYMRINHVGEVCAQALYQSQSLTARSSEMQQEMQQSAQEEIAHLAWCERRLEELGGRKSRLNPVWYGGAFAIGTLAGIAGDKWSLGFVAETEQQVVEHLQKHLGKLPPTDDRSREIVKQMQADEAGHAEQAIHAGAAELPPIIKGIMRGAAKIMTTTAYWL